MLYKTHLDHLIHLASQPGAKAYAWARAKELDKEPTGQWLGIAKDLEKAMHLQKSQSEAQRIGG